jgi:hypothetical protein
MATLNERKDYLADIEAYLSSGQFMIEFQYLGEERRQEMLDLLEKLMELGEAADEIATKIIFHQRGEEGQG